ncbi:MAG: PKD domain-containing protein [Acidobacteria bacterium]|nr:PKD domain-containing protein [Acidobacteriota bacterium]
MKIIVALAAGLLAAGCTLDTVSQPDLAAPSEFGMSIGLTALPDQVPRDGSSQSVVTVTVRNPTGRPVVGQRLSLTASVGTLSETEVVTNSGGQATFAFVAPSSNALGNSATISVTPIGTDAGNALPRTITIAFIGESNRTRPSPSFTATPASPEANAAVRFDASATTDEGAVCLDACSYSWSFGDGSSGSGRIVTHAFTAARIYTVTLTVTDASGASASTASTVTVSAVAAPTITLAVSPDPPLAGQQATFTATPSIASGHSAVRYVWDFGDATTQTTTGPTATKTYSKVGTYVATVTVTDDVGQSASASKQLAITGSGVTASFTVSPTGPKTGDVVQFNGASSTASAGATISKWAWDFGDGETSDETDATTTHKFTAVRTFVVRLTVTDTEGRTGTTTKEVAVTAP